MYTHDIFTWHMCVVKILETSKCCSFSTQKFISVENWGLTYPDACFLKVNFENNPIKVHCNRPLIQQVRQLPQEVRDHHHLGTTWITKAYTALSTPETVGKATADQLAATGWTGSSSVITSPPTIPSIPVRHRRTRGPSYPRRRERYPPSNSCPAAHMPLLPRPNGRTSLL